MLRNTKDIENHAIGATGGHVGQVSTEDHDRGIATILSTPIHFAGTSYEPLSNPVGFSRASESCPANPRRAIDPRPRAAAAGATA
jgi:hypothetical protein